VIRDARLDDIKECGEQVFVDIIIVSAVFIFLSPLLLEHDVINLLCININVKVWLKHLFSLRFIFIPNSVPKMLRQVIQ